MWSLLDPFTGVPFAWLDIVTVLFGIAAAVFYFRAANEDEQPRKSNLQYVGTLLLGSTLLLAGTDSVVTTILAPRHSLVADIVKVKSYSGKNPSCEMAFVDAEGSRHSLVGDFGCERLSVGDHVKATWRAYDGQHVRVDVLTGPDQGFYVENTNYILGFLCLIVGFFVVFIAFLYRKLNADSGSQKDDAEAGTMASADSVQE